MRRGRRRARPPQRTTRSARAHRFRVVRQLRNWVDIRRRMRRPGRQARRGPDVGRTARFRSMRT
jgi:hypothetical protein